MYKLQFTQTLTITYTVDYSIGPNYNSISITINNNILKWYCHNKKTHTLTSRKLKHQSSAKLYSVYLVLLVQVPCGTFLCEYLRGLQLCIFTLTNTKQAELFRLRRHWVTDDCCTWSLSLFHFQSLCTFRARSGAFSVSEQIGLNSVIFYSSSVTS